MLRPADARAAPATLSISRTFLSEKGPPYAPLRPYVGDGDLVAVVFDAAVHEQVELLRHRPRCDERKHANRDAENGQIRAAFLGNTLRMTPTMPLTSASDASVRYPSPQVTGRR